MVPAPINLWCSWRRYFISTDHPREVEDWRYYEARRQSLDDLWVDLPEPIDIKVLEQLPEMGSEGVEIVFDES